jgi:CheY-like chemotaxis protein
MLAAAEGRAAGVRVELRLPGPGSERWLELRGGPLAGGPGGIIAGTVADVTERKQEEARRAAAEKMEAVSGLASGIAHDFNNLLTAVTGQMELLEESFDTGAEARVHIEGVLRSVRRIAAITRQLLAVARRRKGAPKAPDLSTLLDELAAFVDRTQAAADADPRPRSHVPRPAAQASPATILLVEDEPLVRDLGEKALANLGYRVLTAGSATDARRAAARHEGPIALLVTDVDLPDGSGITLAESLAKERPELRVLVVTGHSPDDVSGGAPEFDMLGKPFTLTELSGRVRELLG